MLHRKVQCWIFSIKQISESKTQELCLLLKTIPARGNFWQPVTGSVEPNEGFFEAACREPAEETKFPFSSSPLDTGYEFDFISRQGPTRERIFTLFVEDTPLPQIDPKEHQDFQWIEPQKALKHLRYPSNLEGLRRSYKILFKKDLNELEHDQDGICDEI